MLSFIFALVAVASAASTQTFGAPITLQDALKPTQVLSQPIDGKDVLLDGKIKQVCQKKGCWMTISDEATSFRVTFKDYGFFVPKDGAGRSVRAQGKLVEKEESVADQKHYLKDAGASPAEIDAVKAPRKTRSFIASGVQIQP